MLPDIRDETIYTVWRRPAFRATSRDEAMLLLVGVAAWAGTVAWIGQFRRNPVSEALHAALPASVWFWGSLGLVLLLAVVAWVRGARAQAAGIAVVAAFLLGEIPYGWLAGLIPGDFDIPLRGWGHLWGFAGSRLSWLAGLAATMWVVVRVFPAPVRVQPLLVAGDLAAAGRDTSATRPPMAWWRVLVGPYAIFCAVALVALQSSVGFAPITSGALLRGLPMVLVAALVNATVEEYIFRAFLMPAMLRIGGVAAGLWGQAALFGMMHWGLGVGVLAALPVSLGIGFGSVLWGKAALDTRGMLWVVLAHTMIDVAVMSAYFV